MYIFSNRLENVYTFQALNTNLAFIEKIDETNKQLYINGIKVAYKNIGSFILGNGFIVFSTDKREILKLDIVSFETKKLLQEFSLAEKLHFNQYFIVANRISSEIVNKYVFDVIDEKKVKKIIDNPTIITKNWFLYRNSGNIRSQNWNDKTLWQYSVAELGKRKWVNGSETIKEEGQVSKIIGIMGEVLVVVITGGGDRDRARTQLIGLHTQTGELCWLLDGFEHEGITYPHLPTTATLMPDAQNEFLVGFQNRYFIEIDPQVGKVTRCRKIDNQCQVHNLATIMDSFSLQGDHLYFRTSVSSMGGFPTAIGAFNYKTEEIEWLHVFEEGKFIPINQPKVEGNRVYALDSANTLHIFERE